MAIQLYGSLLGGVSPSFFANMMDRADRSSSIHKICELASFFMGRDQPPQEAYLNISLTTESSMDRVKMIDTGTNKFILTIPVGHKPQGIVVPPSGTYAYVANMEDDTVSVIDLDTFEEIETIATIHKPKWVEITPNGKNAAIANSKGEISLINLSSNQAILRMDVSAPLQKTLTPFHPMLTYISRSEMSFVEGLSKQVFSHKNPRNTTQGIAFVLIPPDLISNNGNITTHKEREPMSVSTTAKAVGGAGLFFFSALTIAYLIHWRRRQQEALTDREWNEEHV